MLVKENWYVITYDDTLHFTNNKDAATPIEVIANPPQDGAGIAEDGTKNLLIKENTILRLVCDQTDEPASEPVNATFYDYDISNGKVRTSGSAKIIETRAEGINSTKNCSDEDKYAFGNNNAGTKYGTKTWNGNELNKHNANGYKGCTFGLASGRLVDGVIQLNVAAPKIFGSTPQVGKTIHNDYSLKFNRLGDTYTLSAVNGAGTQGLEKFTNTTGEIWSNNFWPMDSASTWGPADMT